MIGRRQFITLLGGAAAARGARAAGGKATDHRVLWPEHGLGLEAVDRCFCGARHQQHRVRPRDF
jgi:hypothetical protein